MEVPWHAATLRGVTVDSVAACCYYSDLNTWAGAGEFPPAGSDQRNKFS